MNVPIDFLKEAQNLFEYTRQMRRDFHMHPEIAFNENRTAKKISEELIKVGLPVRNNVGKTGVVSFIEGKNPDPVIMLRFDMDALPIQEENDVSYASQNPGIMHACGHDAHMAIGLTIAKILASHKNEIPGSIKLVFQPAEEGTRGAMEMIADGVLDNPRPKYALGCHVWNDKPVGWLGIVPGPFMAGVKDFEIEIRGVGGHGATPHRTVDPIVTAAQIVTAFQTIVARNLSPLEAGVVSVTQIEAGRAFNVIPSSALMRGTIRYFDVDVCKRIEERMDKILEGISQAMGCGYSFKFCNDTPPVINDVEVISTVSQVARAILSSSVIDSKYQTMGAEDMADFLNIIPGAFIFMGSSNAEKGLNFGHHNPKFDIDETTLPQGVALLAASAIELIGK
jgi:amidohydrolase